MTIDPFRIAIPPASIDDLHRRLAATRWPDEIDGAGWTYGTDQAYLQGLVADWRDRFDWRAQEAVLNDLPQFTAEIGGMRIHFVHVRGEGGSSAPLILTHGWPSSFAEFARLIPLLTTPSRFGGRAEDAFDVIVPSLPGFGFSAQPGRQGISSQGVAEKWHRLMTEKLGYARYFAQGGDIGAGVTSRLGRCFPEQVAAIHVLSAPFFPLPADEATTPAEREYVDRVREWSEAEGAYAHQQRTKPQTLAVGLADSPSGLAAWIVEKWRAWSDCQGDLDSRFTRDEILTNLSIYWFTGTIGSSVRMYYESAHQPAAAWPGGQVTVPARVFVTRESIPQAPEDWARRSYARLSYGTAPRGGHFLAAEEPALLADDIRAAFRPYRD